MKLNHKISGSGKPVIIMHGLFGMLDNWRSIARMLEDDFQCILVDLRNHGRSPHTDEMSYHLMVTDVIGFMDELQLSKAIIVGHSMGGKVAMHLALEHPDRVEKLIVVDIAPKEYPPHHQEVIAAIQAINPETMVDRAAAEKTFSQFLGDDQATIQFLLKNLSRKPEGGFEWKANMASLINHYTDLMEGIIPEATYSGPVLFIRGSESGSVLDEDWPSILDLFPNAVLISIPGAGHWVHADAPEPFAHELKQFMTE